MKRPSESAQAETEDGEHLATDKKLKNSDQPQEISLDKKLSNMIKYKKKFSMTKPKFMLTAGNEIEASLESAQPQFFVQDLQRVILYSLIGNQYRFFPRYHIVKTNNYRKRARKVPDNC